MHEQVSHYDPKHKPDQRKYAVSQLEKIDLDEQLLSPTAIQTIVDEIFLDKPHVELGNRTVMEWIKDPNFSMYIGHPPGAEGRGAGMDHSTRPQTPPRVHPIQGRRYRRRTSQRHRNTGST
jgi:hypothetical protein